MRIHTDARRTAVCDIFGEATPGDVNVFSLNPAMPSGWHRHLNQTDRFLVLQGTVRFGRWVTGEWPAYRDVTGVDGMIEVPPLYWHGYEAVGGPALLLMYLSHKYADGWDEEKKSFEEVPWAPI